MDDVGLDMGIHQGWRRDELCPLRQSAAAVMITAFSAGFLPAHGSVAVSHTAIALAIVLLLLSIRRASERTEPKTLRAT